MSYNLIGTSRCPSVSQERKVNQNFVVSVGQDVGQLCSGESLDLVSTDEHKLISDVHVKWKDFLRQMKRATFCPWWTNSELQLKSKINSERC